MSRYARIFETNSNRENVQQPDKRQISLSDKPVNEKLVTDPRPDLSDDHHLWNDLLYIAAQKNEMLAGVLHGFRCMGTRIRKNRDGKFVLRADIDSDGNRAWESQGQYDEARDYWLKGYRNEVVELLGQLSELADDEKLAAG